MNGRQSFRAILIMAIAAVATGAAVLVAQPAYAAGVTATFTKTSSWETGFEAKYTITNGGTATISNWTVAFDLPAGVSISASWDSVRTDSGNRHSFANAGWNGTIPAGGTASFGFDAVGSGSAVPANCTVNGASCGGGPPPPPDTTPPSVPGGLRVTGTASSTISLAWNASTDNVGVTGYEVRRDGSTILTASTTSFTDVGLGANTTHSYVVRAVDAAGNRSAFSASVSGTTTTGGGGNAGMNAAPYYFPGFGTPLPNPATVISATGIRWFTIAFVLASGCNAVWDGEGGLTGGQHQASINAIRAAGGDIIPSFGGYNGSKLGEACTTPAALAAQYLRVVDQFSLQAIDIDIEANEFDNDAARNRVVDALKLVKQQRPALKVIVTIPITTSGPNFAGTQLINRAASTQANIDVFTIMPFDFGGGSNMFNSTVSAANGTRNALKTAFGWSDATAYAHLGISGMNGLSDQSELTSPATWTQIRDFAASNHLARLAFWGVNRDRGCAGQAVNSSCSSIAQSDWQFTAITAGFRP